MLALADLAREIGADTRTMRRAVTDGTIRCERSSPRRQNVDEDEYRYAIAHWPLLAKLRELLRTEPNVRLAVLYGSTATGVDTSSSDVDLLVSLARDRSEAAVQLATRLERRLGRDVDVARLNRVRDSAALLLLQAIDEGRVLLDRDGLWATLQAERAEIERQAHREYEAQRLRARISVDELLATLA
ncbi:MAG TPA: nucleotidyltransferase domain-containing protein [Solirubrobacteraceae bacterium]|jgi:predicted nucleotidyltransferase|nr:nucleotidyltransferase domain-containing protein [Solirubrobacteraceae bacterium]